MFTSKTSLIFAIILVFSLAGCNRSDSNSGMTSPKIEIKYSKIESCREVSRLIGKTTDQIMKQLGSTSIKLTEVAVEFDELSTKTKDEDLKAAIARIASALRKMSVESTFFEGNSMYSAEIIPITALCY